MINEIIIFTDLLSNQNLTFKDFSYHEKIIICVQTPIVSNSPLLLDEKDNIDDCSAFLHGATWNVLANKQWNHTKPMHRSLVPLPLIASKFTCFRLYSYRMITKPFWLGSRYNSRWEEPFRVTLFTFQLKSLQMKYHKNYLERFQFLCFKLTKIIFRKGLLSSSITCIYLLLCGASSGCLVKILNDLMWS